MTGDTASTAELCLSQWLGRPLPKHSETFHPKISFNIVQVSAWKQGLLPALRRPGDWDVLVAHYLGVDHAGHSQGISGPAMTAKLHQLNSHILQVQ